MDKITSIEAQQEISRLRAEHFDENTKTWMSDKPRNLPATPEETLEFQRKVRQLKFVGQLESDLEMVRQPSTPMKQKLALAALIDRRNNLDLWKYIGKTELDGTLFTFSEHKTSGLICNCSDEQITEEFVGGRATEGDRKKARQKHNEDLANFSNDAEYARTRSICPNPRLGWLIEKAPLPITKECGCTIRQLAAEIKLEDSQTISQDQIDAAKQKHNEYIAAHVPCTSCKGTGQLPAYDIQTLLAEEEHQPDDFKTGEVKCAMCDGTGDLNELTPVCKNIVERTERENTHTIGNVACQACLSIGTDGSDGSNAAALFAQPKTFECCPKFISVLRTSTMAEYIDALNAGKKTPLKLHCYAGLLHSEMRFDRLLRNSKGELFANDVVTIWREQEAMVEVDVMILIKKCDTCDYKHSEIKEYTPAPQIKPGQPLNA